MAKTEKLLNKFEELRLKTGIPRTIFAVCPNSFSVIRASFRAAKRNDAPIYFAATLNQVDGDGGYTGMTQAQFTEKLRQEANRVNFEGLYITAIDHGGPWLKDIQRVEKWSIEDAMNAVKKSFEDAVLAGYDLIHVDPTVDITLAKDETINIHVVVRRTVELIEHVEKFRRERNLPEISYEVGTEEVHGGLADEATFDTFLVELKSSLAKIGLADIWPCFIVGKVGTDLHTTFFDPEVARTLTSKVRPYGSWIKGHYTDAVDNPEEYPLSGMGAANVGPEFTISEYEALQELDKLEEKFYKEGKIATYSKMIETLTRLVYESNRWQKWLQEDELDKEFYELSPERKEWIVGTCCRYIWEHDDATKTRKLLYENLKKVGVDGEEVVLSHIERDMDKYFRAFNLIGVNELI